MVSAASLLMTTRMEQEQPQLLPQQMELKSPPPAPAAAAEANPNNPAEAPQPMDVPDQIVVGKKEKKSSSSKSHRRRSSKEKDKAHKRKSSSGKHDRKKRASKDGKDRKERRHRRKKHRKSSKSDPDPNDPETMAKSRELLLAAMGVKKQPDIAPCFVSEKSSLDNNPVYQSNQKRLSKGLSTSQSESHLPTRGSVTTMETARSMDDLVGFHHDSLRMDMTGSSIPEEGEQQQQDDSEYDQYVEF